MTYTLLDSQAKEADFWRDNTRIFNNSDAGTGKTLATLEGYKRSIKGRLLVAAPLSILRPSWGSDIDKFMPGFSWAVAHGSPDKRRAAFTSNADIVLINHDGVNYLEENLHLLKGFSHYAIDEYTAFKNRNANRSKACLRVANAIEYLTQLSGTPNTRSILDVWHPAFMLDHGLRLGSKFWEFRSQVCAPIQNGPDPKHIMWVDRPGAIENVTARLADITIRHELTGLPENVEYTLFVDMPAAVMRQYRELERDAVLVGGQGVVTAVNAGVKVKKMLQLLSGAVYDAMGNVVKFHPHRTELVIDLVEARRHSIVAFNWSHERDSLCELATKRGITHAVIDGDVPLKRREAIVEDFQNGKIQVIFIHPQSGAHGLTLTRGTTTIWASPTYNAEHFKQFNRRIYRRGQTLRTETIRICARDTKEEYVYGKLDEKLVNMHTLLDLFANMTGEAA
jgi:SNF2 family DNA or RNA helicase